MSLISAQLGPDFALIGVDYRTSNGPERTADLGGKLTYTRSGWCGCAGMMDAHRAELAQLVAARYSDGSPEDFGAHFARAAHEFRIGREGEEGATSNAQVSVLGPDGPRLHQVSTDGKMWTATEGRLMFSVLDDVPVEYVDQVQEELGGATDLLEAVRRMAEGAIRVTEGSGLVSEHLLIAALVDGETPRRVTWSGEARWLRDAADAELEERTQRFFAPRPVRSEEEPVKTHGETASDLYRDASRTAHVQAIVQNLRDSGHIDGASMEIDDGSANRAGIGGVVPSTSDPSGDYPDRTIWAVV